MPQGARSFSSTIFFVEDKESPATQRFELSDEERARCFALLLEGRDVRDSYSLLWPTEPPAPYEVFLDRYSQLMAWYYTTAGSAAKVGLDEEESEAAKERAAIRKGLKDDFDALDGVGEITEDQARPFALRCKLAAVHRALCADKRGEGKATIEKTAAMHNLMASNAERDRD